MLERMPNESLGDYIARLRINKGYSQRKFAQLSGLSNTTISRIEKGETASPDLDTIKLLAKYLDVDEMKLIEYPSNAKVRQDDAVSVSSNIKAEAAVQKESVLPSSKASVNIETSKSSEIEEPVNISLKGMRLITLRLERNITQKELGDALGVDKTTISQYEGEIVKPDMNMIIKLANFFDVSVSYLTGNPDYIDKPCSTVEKDSDANEASYYEPEQLSYEDIEVVELEPDYIKLAKELQDSNIHPDDIRAIAAVLLRYK